MSIDLGDTTTTVSEKVTVFEFGDVREREWEAGRRGIRRRFDLVFMLRTVLLSVSRARLLGFWRASLPVMFLTLSEETFDRWFMV